MWLAAILLLPLWLLRKAVAIGHRWPRSSMRKATFRILLRLSRPIIALALGLLLLEWRSPIAFATLLESPKFSLILAALAAASGSWVSLGTTT